MSSFSTPAIMLRRIDFGDYDLIITFYTRDRGKVSVIAKSAKKSMKRFAGILERFSSLGIVCTAGRGKGLPVLKEATMLKPFENIRTDIIKTAYASYWTELIDEWMEKNAKNIQVYHLFEYVLSELDKGEASLEALSILFQMRFMALAGLSPNLGYCSICHTQTEEIKCEKLIFDLRKGRVACEKCYPGSGHIHLSKGTVKQLQWIGDGDLKRAVRIRFAIHALAESLRFLETFVPYHIGRELKSLKFLKQIRR
jgi:DNA repair protein RecO (recombination protein O)